MFRVYFFLNGIKVACNIFKVKRKIKLNEDNSYIKISKTYKSIFFILNGIKASSLFAKTGIS